MIKFRFVNTKKELSGNKVSFSLVNLFSCISLYSYIELKRVCQANYLIDVLDSELQLITHSQALLAQTNLSSVSD